MLSSRALLLAFPALMVVGGALLVARNPEWPPVQGSTNRDQSDFEIAIDVSVDDENRMQIISQKQKIAIELLNNRCTLVEAASRFLDLNLQSPEATENLRFAWEGTDWERSLCQAVAFARSLSRRDPERFDREMHRIDDEASSLVQSESSLR